MVVQGTYEINPDRGFPGDLARPTEPHALDSGVIHVPAAAPRKPRPGDAVYYNTTEDAYAIPTTAANLAVVVGILSYRKDVVQSGAARDTVEYSDGAEVEVGVHGTFWVTAGSAIEYGGRIIWDIADYKWDALTIPAVAGANVAAVVTSINATLTAYGRTPIACVSRQAVAADGLAQARIGFGRIN